jgi:hypothetical protein
LAIRYAPEEAERVEAVLQREQLIPAELFCREGKDYRRL